MDESLKHPAQPWYIAFYCFRSISNIDRCRYLRVPFATSKHAEKGRVDEDHPARLIPEESAGLFSRLTFGWMTSILSTGYARPLEIDDLYALQDDRSASCIGKRIQESFERRRKLADFYNAKLLAGEVKPRWRSLWWTLHGNRSERERYWRSIGGQKHPSLILAFNDSVKWWFWSAGLFKVC